MLLHKISMQLSSCIFLFSIYTEARFLLFDQVLRKDTPEKVTTQICPEKCQVENDSAAPGMPFNNVNWLKMMNNSNRSRPTESERFICVGFSYYEGPLRCIKAFFHKCMFSWPRFIKMSLKNSEIIKAGVKKYFENF